MAHDPELLVARNAFRNRAAQHSCGWARAELHGSSVCREGDLEIVLRAALRALADGRPWARASLRGAAARLWHEAAERARERAVLTAQEIWCAVLTAHHWRLRARAGHRAVVSRSLHEAAALARGEHRDEGHGARGTSDKSRAS